MATSSALSSGSSGSPIVDTGSFASPAVITTTVAVPVDLRARIFLVGSGAVVNPTLGAGASAQELHIYGTSNTNTVELNSASNLLLSGKIILKNGTYLLLHWITGLDKWVEVSRNEI
jgi:hypothetical protein